MWWHLAVGPLGVIESWAWNSHKWCQCSCVRDPRGLPLLLLPCEDTARKLLSINQEAGPHQRPNLLTLRSWMFQPLERWEINICGLQATQSMVFHYSSQNRLRQYRTPFEWGRHPLYLRLELVGTTNETQWIWIWVKWLMVNDGEPGMLQSIWLQRPRHDWTTNKTMKNTAVFWVCQLELFFKPFGVSKTKNSSCWALSFLIFKPMCILREI